MYEIHNKMSIIIFKYVYEVLSLLYTSITDQSLQNLHKIMFYVMIM